jgi:hypothetical protein
MNFWIANLHLFLFIYDLFQDAAVFRMTGLLMNDLERKQLWPNLKVLSQQLPEGTGANQQAPSIITVIEYLT